MSLPLTLACLWVLAAAITAMVPLRRQYVPGIALLILAPIVLAWIAVAHGLWLAVFGTLAVASMFRNPLIYAVRRALGQPTHRP